MALIWNIVLSYKSNKLIYHMYDEDGQNPLPQWALGPGATVWRTKILGHEYLLKKKKKK